MRRILLTGVIFVLLTALVVGITWTVGLIDSLSGLLIAAGLAAVGVATVMALFIPLLEKKAPSAQPPPADPATAPAGPATQDHSIHISQTVGGEVAPGGQVTGLEIKHVEHLVLQQATGSPAPSPKFTLPGPPTDFTGREAELEQLEAVFNPGPEPQAGAAVLITGITGGAGIGKTALARCLAQRIADRFPEARLEIDLKGAARPPERPLEPFDAQRRLLAPFYPGLALPDDPQELHNLYQETFRRQAYLLLLDNAHSAAQVRPLLPPLPSAAILTSRANFQLAEAGLRPLRLDLLDLDPARRLLRLVSPRLLGEPDADVDRVAQACGRLPLALRVAASLFEERPDWTLAELLSRLQDERTRLATLRRPDDPELDVIACFELSYLTLSPDLQERFRMLGVFPAPFERIALAAVWDAVDNLSASAEGDLGALLSRNLLDYRPVTQDYALHDLTRLYSQQLLLDRPAEARSALQRHAEFYLNAAAGANQLYLQGGENIPPALVGFARLWPHLSAAWARLADPDSGWPAFDQSEPWLTDFPARMVYVFDLRLTPRQKIPYLERAVSAARRTGDRLREGDHLGNLGLAYWYLGELRKAIEHYQQVLEIARQAGDRRMEGGALGNLGNAYADLGDPSKAIEYYQQALEIDRQVGDRRGEGADLGNLGAAYADLGEPSKAIEYYQQVLEIAREIKDRHMEGKTLGNQGQHYADLGQLSKAIEFYEQAIEIDRQIGDRRGEGIHLGNLGLAYSNLGEPSKAIEYYEQALEFARQIDDRILEARTLHNTGSAYAYLYNTEQARLCYQQALAIFETIFPPDHPNIQSTRRNLAKLPPAA